MEMIAVYSDNHAIHMNYKLPNDKTGGTLVMDVLFKGCFIIRYRIHICSTVTKPSSVVSSNKTGMENRR
jgi:hypothetical protein